MSFDADERPRRTSQPHTRTRIRYSRRTDTTDHHELIGGHLDEDAGPDQVVVGIETDRGP
ncbi:hypothetical protein BBK14_33110 [Parafrankia soli]|uniref:Uncharacterized protein n=1 Tax=Parafrankia soli TaxID=2599596 RepID=A0A1S1QUQ0_9ACTN|nr:hypothetical protein BBK14_33110 [Parafrankia soli]